MFGLTPFERKGYDIFNPFDDFEREFFGERAPRMMPGSPEHRLPHEFRTDIQESDNEYVLEADLPGFKKEDIAIDITKDLLTISASHVENKEEKNEEGKFIRKERYSGKYSRSFGITGIDAEDDSVTGKEET